MYAGALFTAGETPGGALFLSTFDTSKYVPVVKRMDIRFKRPAVTDVTVAIELSQEEVDRVNRELEARDRSDFVLDGELKDAEGKVVAETTATYQIRTMT
jgi:acyl-CoA thioesterase FadM